MKKGCGCVLLVIGGLVVLMVAVGMLIGDGDLVIGEDPTATIAPAVLETTVTESEFETETAPTAPPAVTPAATAPPDDAAAQENP